MSRIWSWVTQSRWGRAGGVIALAAGGATLGLDTSHGAVSASDYQTIVQLVHDSQLAEQTACLPAGLNPQASVITVASAATVATVQARIASVEPNYYTGDYETGLTGLLQRNCRAALTGGQSMDLAGGVGPISCSDVSVSGTTAHATCQLQEWLRGLVDYGNGGVRTVQPSGPDIVNDNFVQTPSGWRISSEERYPVPGTGP